MIVKNEREQWVGCTICGEQVELRRNTLANPETVLILVDHLKAEHKDCEQYAHDPRQAALQRAFKVGIRREMERAARKGRSTPRVSAPCS